jgi:hypothetical protein
MFTIDQMIEELKRMLAKEKSIKSRVLIKNAIEALSELKERIGFE